MTREILRAVALGLGVAGALVAILAGLAVLVS